MERNLNDAFALLAEMGVGDDDALGLKMKKKSADQDALTKEDEDYLDQEDVVSVPKKLQICSKRA